MWIKYFNMKNLKLFKKLDLFGRILVSIFYFHLSLVLSEDYQNGDNILHILAILYILHVYILHMHLYVLLIKLPPPTQISKKEVWIV